MVDLTEAQKEILQAAGHQLVTGGPGSGKTTISILKAAKIAREELKPGQRILFLSFARATVSRVLEAIDEHAVFPVHPRTRHRLEAAGLWGTLDARPSLRLSPPVGYLDFTALLTRARAVVTDSGGVQKEAYFHGIPCVTLRETTEWTETVEGGFNRLAGMDPARVRAALRDLSMPAERPPYYGDGAASERIAELVVAARGERGPNTPPTSPQG